jgi:hypothetical protein
MSLGLKMKNVLLSAALVVCASSSVTSAAVFHGCEVRKIVGSNAYYRSDVTCQFGAGANDAGVKASAPAAPAPVSPEEEPIEVVGPVDTPADLPDQGDAAPVTAEDPVNGEPQPIPTDDVIAEQEPVVLPPATEPPVTDKPVTGKPVTGKPVKDKPVKPEHDDNGHGNDEDGFDESNPGGKNK